MGPIFLHTLGLVTGDLNTILLHVTWGPDFKGSFQSPNPGLGHQGVGSEKLRL